ncbi:MAG: TlpA family protein disulfide reductase [Pyrinomonadaceae bacterium]
MTLARSLFLLAISSNILLVSFAAPDPSRAKGAAKPTKKIAVQEIDLDGLKKLVGRDPAKPRPLLVNFWATWCDPCREEFPDLVKIDRDYRRKGLDFAAISLDDKQELKTGVPRFLRQMRATMPAYLLSADDPEPAITFVDAQWSGALPATFLYDSRGNVAYKHFGRISPKDLRAAIEKVLTKEQ